MNYPDKTESLVLLREWEQVFLSNWRVLDDLGVVFGAVYECPLSDAVWGCFDAYTDILAAQIGAGDLMRWYQYENDWGRKGLLMGCGDKLRKIKTLNGLWWLIAQKRACK